MPYTYAEARFDDLDLDARSQWVGKGENSALNALGKSVKSWKSVGNDKDDSDANSKQ